MSDFDGLLLRALRNACAIVFASRKSRMGPLLIGERKRSVPALPTVRQWRGIGRKLIRSPIPEGAGGGCINPTTILAKATMCCQARRRGNLSALGHVWTAPGWQEES
jgi:hypothetical protein